MTNSAKTFEQILKQVPMDYYDKGIRTNPLQKYWHTKKWKTLREFLPSSGSLLDIGCADGTTTFEIYKHFPKLKVTGIDYYKKAIDFAKKTKPGVTFIHGDAHSLPFKNGQFNVVTTIEILEHLQNPEVALKEIYRVLKKDGYLVVVQDTDSLLFKSVWWIWTKWRGAVWNGSHINCLHPDQLIRVLKKTGFKIKQTHFTNLKMEIFIKAQKTPSKKLFFKAYLPHT